MNYSLKSSKGGLRAEKVYVWNEDASVKTASSGSSASQRGRGTKAAGQPKAIRYRRSGKGAAAKPMSRSDRQNARAVSPAARKRTVKKKTALQQLQELRAAATAGETEPRIRTVRAREKKAFPTGIIFSCLVCSLLFMYLIYNSVQISEANREIRILKSTRTELEVQKKELELALEKKNDLLMIEKEAKALGMVKRDQLSKQYITITGDDRIEVIGDGGE